jgi:amidase
MQRVSRAHTVPPGKRYRVAEPVAEVELGESFIVETINFRTPIIRTAQDANPATYREREETGPIYVRGIAPGDVLAVEIEDIQPEGHASGGWWRDPHENSFLPIADSRVHFPGGLHAPLQMMIGDIYVTPATPCNNPDRNGGNMDFKDIAPGNTLYLRSEREGGLLVLGDLHAAQGDGEILGLAAECAGVVRLRIGKDEIYQPVRPLIRKADSFVCLAFDQDYARARDQAVNDATGILARVAGVTLEEAYLFVTTVGDLRNGAVWMMGRTDLRWQMPIAVAVEVPLLPR